MKKLKIAGLSALTLLGSLATSQAQATTAPVGYVTINIDPAPSINTGQYSYLSLSLAQDNSAPSGIISSGSVGTVTVTGATYNVNDYAATNGPYYLITEDGDIYDITTNTIDTFTVDSTENLNALASKKFKVYKHQTIQSIFGTTPTDVIGASKATDADQILIYNHVTSSYTSYFYKNAPDGRNSTIGWVDSSDPTTVVTNTIIDPDLGFLYYRVSTTPLAVTVAGTVINSAIKVPITNGYTLVNIPYPVDTSLTLASSGLYPETGHDINLHLEGAAKASDADLVLISNGTNFDSYFYKNAPDGRNSTIGWVNSAAPTIAVPNTAIPSGSSFFIYRKNSNPTLNWKFDSIIPSL